MYPVIHSKTIRELAVLGSPSQGIFIIFLCEF